MVRISVPSKTFLIGEYGCLTGGPALILNTGPRFSLTLDRKGQSDSGLDTKPEFGPESPAGRLIESFQDYFRGQVISFDDPYNGTGGLGASSAQYVLITALLLKWQNQRPHNGKPHLEGLLAMWRTFQRYSESGGPSKEGLERSWSPSGYDLLAQSVGSVAKVQPSKGIVTALNWNFSDLGFVILKTGIKISTHKHLAELKQSGFGILSAISEEAIQAYERSDELHFISSLAKFSRELESQGLISPESRGYQSQIANIPGVLHCRGCGALGADTLIAIFPKNLKERIIEELVGYQVVATEEEISCGFRVEEREPAREVLIEI